MSKNSTECNIKKQKNIGWIDPAKMIDSSKYAAIYSSKFALYNYELVALGLYAYNCLMTAAKLGELIMIICLE